MTTVRILQGDALTRLRELPSGSVHCIVTSPPYYGLRKYLPDGHPDKRFELGNERVPDCLGWATGHPCGECYVCHLLAVFTECWRVLRDDGVCFLNLGDSYAGSGAGGGGNRKGNEHGQHDDMAMIGRPDVPSGLKAKDLIGIPWRVAFALQAAGWWLRSDNIWAKGLSLLPDYAGSSMPESVEDRPSKSHEYVFLLTKSARYFWDQEAVKEDAATGANGKTGGNGAGCVSQAERIESGKRNLRTVWVLNEPMARLRQDLDPETRARIVVQLVERGLI